MGRYAIALVLLLPALRAVVSQITTTPGCYIGSPISVMPACDRYNAVPSVCSGIPSRTGLLGCMCKQKHINDIVDCQSEFRLCYFNDESDHLFQSDLMSWHSICDTYINFTPTTPVLSSLNAATTRNNNFCRSDVVHNCLSASANNEQCSPLADNPSALSSCLCEPSLILNLYTCLFLGNASCQAGTTAALTNVPLYTFCSNAPQVVAAATTRAVATTPTLLPTPTGSSPSLPASTKPSGANRGVASQKMALLGDVALLLLMHWLLLR